MLFGRAPRETLHSAKSRQQSVVRPAPRSRGLGPSVEIFPRSAHMAHGVQATRPADNAPAGPIVHSAGRPRLRCGAVRPVIVASRQQRPFLWNGDVGIGRGSPGLEQPHRERRVLAQPPRQHAARGAGSHNEYIEVHERISSAAFSAIISTAALMLPLTRSGMTDASTTRSASTPRSFNLLSTTASSSVSRPIRQVPAGW